LDILLPRASFSYDLPPDTEDGLDMTFRGGVGRYSGGAPNVWVSNNYSNDGMQQVLLTGIPGTGPLAGLTPDFLNTTPGGGLTNLEQVHPALESLLSALSSNGTVNALAPDFKLPSIWRSNLALDLRWEDWDATIEYLRTDAVDQLYYQDLRMVPIDTGPDGRIIYDHITTVDPTKVRPTGVGDLVLRNADGGVGEFIMAGIGKRFDIDEGRGDVRLRFDYVHSEVEDLGGLTSSVAGSNFSAQAKNAMNEPELGRSSYEREHIYKVRASAGYRFFDFLESRLSMFGVSMSGQGISYTFASNPYVDNINVASNPGGVSQTYNDSQPGNRALLYVPKTNAAGVVECSGGASSDPAVVFNFTPAQCTNFNNYLVQTGLIDYAGGIAPRNFNDGPDITRIDLAFEQELNFFGDHRAVLEFNIFNFTNLLNKKWGLWQTPVFQNVQQVVTANYDRETDTYHFNQLQTGNGLQISTEASQWQAQVGIRYEF
jgi:hypothetical protein